MNSGSCSRPACSGQPAAWLAYDYSARCAWIDDPIDETVGGRPDRSSSLASVRAPCRQPSSTRGLVPCRPKSRCSRGLDCRRRRLFPGGPAEQSEAGSGALMPAVAMPAAMRPAVARPARHLARAMTRRTTTPFSPCPGFVHDFSKGDGRLVPMFSKEPLRDLLAGSTPPPCCPLLFWRSAAHVFLRRSHPPLRLPSSLAVGGKSRSPARREPAQ